MGHANKVKRVKELTQDLMGKSMIYVDYKGINVHDCNVIRSSLRQEGGRFLVFKNTLLKQALEAGKIDYDESIFTGMTALAIMDDESFGNGGKVLYEAEKKQKVVIKGGYYQGASMVARAVQKLVSLPSREVLMGMLVGSLQGVFSNLIHVLDGVVQHKNKEDNNNKKQSNQKED